MTQSQRSILRNKRHAWQRESGRLDKKSHTVAIYVHFDILISMALSTKSQNTVVNFFMVEKFPLPIVCASVRKPLF